MLNKMIRDSQSLSLEELSELQAHLSELLSEKKKSRQPGREIVEAKTVGLTSYYLIGTTCGKKGCKCSRGELHGPYWYSYRQENGKAGYKYVGKNLPDCAGLLNFSKKLRARSELGRTKSAKIQDKAQNALNKSRRLLSR